MIVGFRDRTGDQVGFFNYLYESGPTTTTEGTSGGDLLRACKTSAGFVLQGGTGCAVKVSNNQGPGGGEWYSGEDYPTGHDETAQGEERSVFRHKSTCEFRGRPVIVRLATAAQIEDEGVNFFAGETVQGCVHFL